MADNSKSKKDFSKILPVLFLEYLTISLGRTLFPKYLVKNFGSYSYLVLGLSETVKGLLAFVSSPLFGKLSDMIGRKFCLLITVIGSSLPICIMAFNDDILLYIVMSSLSGFFSATFALTFAYISDCVDPSDRAPCYGLALATFGLSFCLGPVTGSYLEEIYGAHVVWVICNVLLVLNIIYMIFSLPETATFTEESTTYQKMNTALKYIPNSWSLVETFAIFSADPFLSNIAIIVFVHYTAVWAIVSTLMLYITTHLNFTPVSLGWLMSCYGLATIFSEAVLVRIIVPRIGETASMRIGLIAFSMQCIVVACGKKPEWIFVSLFFSMFANLFYPSVSSLVSKIVPEQHLGESLGALNGVKALTEGFGPLFFGLIMALYDHTPMPGAPYLIAALLSCWAYLHCFELPAEPDIAYAKNNASYRDSDETTFGLLEGTYRTPPRMRSRSSQSLPHLDDT